MQITPTWIAGMVAFVGGIISHLLGSTELGWALIIMGGGALGFSRPPARNQPRQP